MFNLPEMKIVESPDESTDNEYKRLFLLDLITVYPSKRFTFVV